jgi:hypothetical protein
MKRPMRTSLPLLALLLAFGVATPAAAQPATAQAEVLFREGKRLMAEGNITAACEAFEGSYKKDASNSTLMNLGDCREKNQQYASAWAHFLEVARLTARDPAFEGLRKSALERAARVEAKLSYLIISVPDEARVAGLVITRNGIVVEPVEWNRDIPVDGGTHEIEGKAPAYEAWSTKLTVGAAKDKQSVNVPRFREAITAPGEASETPNSSSGWTGKRKLALGLGAVGVMALGGGLAFELKSGSTFDDAKASQDNGDRHELTDQANRERDVAMVVGGVGAAAVGVGVYLWFRGQPKERAVAIRPAVGEQSVVLTMRGYF